MRKLQTWVALTLLLALATPSIQAQPAYVQDDETCCSAYNNSCHAAHWSAYVPIGLIVAAAIVFAIADQNHKEESTYSQSGTTTGHF